MGKSVTEAHVVEIKTLGIVDMKVKIINGIISTIYISDPINEFSSMFIPHDNTIKSLLKFKVQIVDMIEYCLKYLKEADHDPI